MAVTALFFLPLQAQAERNWEFSVGVFGGKAYHSNESMKYSDGQGGVVTAETAYDLNLDDAPTFGGKLTLDIFPGNITGNRKLVLSLTGLALLQISIHKPFLPREPSPFLDSSWAVSHSSYPSTSASMYWVLAANLLFRYPIWATPEMPQGRWYPYLGAGLGAQRAHMTQSGFQETSYSPAVRGLIGAKFFLIKNLAIFAEVKRTTGWHTFDFEGSGAPPGFYEKFTISSNHFVAGVALHF